VLGGANEGWIWSTPGLISSHFQTMHRQTSLVGQTNKHFQEANLSQKLQRSKHTAGR